MSVNKITFGDMRAAAAMGDIDDACLHLQTIAGITDGGIAGLYFSGDDVDENWPTMLQGTRLQHIFAWLTLELAYEKGAEEACSS